jgi:hypothetical protein
MIVCRKIVFRGNGHCVALPLPLLEFSGLKPGGSCIVEATDHNTIQIRRVEARDLVQGVRVPSLTLDASMPVAK